MRAAVVAKRSSSHSRNATRSAAALGVARVDGRCFPERRDECAVVLAGREREREPGVVLDRARLRREDPRSRIGRATDVMAIDEQRAEPLARELVAERRADEPTAGDDDVVRVGHPSIVVVSSPQTQRPGPRVRAIAPGRPE